MDDRKHKISVIRQFLIDFSWAQREYLAKGERFPIEQWAENLLTQLVQVDIDVEQAEREKEYAS